MIARSDAQHNSNASIRQSKSSSPPRTARMERTLPFDVRCIAIESFRIHYVVCVHRAVVHWNELYCDRKPTAICHTFLVFQSNFCSTRQFITVFPCICMCVVVRFVVWAAWTSVRVVAWILCVPIERRLRRKTKLPQHSQQRQQLAASSGGGSDYGTNSSSSTVRCVFVFRLPHVCTVRCVPICGYGCSFARAALVRLFDLTLLKLEFS